MKTFPILSKVSNSNQKLKVRRRSLKGIRSSFAHELQWVLFVQNVLTHASPLLQGWQKLERIHNPCDDYLIRSQAGATNFSLKQFPKKPHKTHLTSSSLESLQLLSTVIPNPWSLICWNVASRKRKLPFVYQLISISSVVEKKRTSICFNSLESQEYNMCMHSWIWFLQMELYTSNSMMRCTSQNILVFAPNKCKLE